MHRQARARVADALIVELATLWELGPARRAAAHAGAVAVTFIGDRAELFVIAWRHLGDVGVDAFMFGACGGLVDDLDEVA